MNAMKTFTRITVQILLFVLIAFTVVMSFYACQKIEDPTRGVKLILNYDLLKTNINVRFYDAATGLRIGAEDGKQVSVSISGETSSAVIDMAGESGKTYKSGGGYMTLYLNPNVEYQPDIDNPIRFTIVAQLDGYLEASRSMVITKEGDYFVEMTMVQSQLPPEGVVIARETEVGTLIQGKVQADISVKTNKNQASVLIQEGTVIKDENGNTLGGSLNVEITYFNNLADQSLAAFPGGLLSGLQKNGNAEDGVFYTAGFLSVEITDNNGRKAKTFEGEPLAISIMVSEQTYNPQTFSNINTGDNVSVFSYDPAAGYWDYEQSSTMQASYSGMEVTAWINHLSYWNFGWFFGNNCDEGVDLLFTGDQSACECVNVKGIMRKSEDDTFLRFVNIEACDGEPVTITNAPANLPVYIEWQDTDCSNYYVDPSSNPLQLNNLCSSEQYSVPMVSENNQTATISIDVTAHCTQYPDVEVHPTFGVWFRELDGICWRWAYMYDGKADICDVEMGKDYVIGAYFNNTWNEWDVTVSQTEYVVLDMKLPDDVCSTMFN